MSNPFRWLAARKAEYESGLYELLPHIVRDAALSGVIVSAAFIWGGAVLGLISLLVPIYSFVVFSTKYYEHERVSQRKGHRLQHCEKVRLKARKLRLERFGNERGILWGRSRIPTKDSEKSFLVVGNIGSGKTLAIRTLMKDQLPLIRPYSGKRALIYDSKQDVVQAVAGMSLDCPTCIFNPFDRRGVGWDLAKDIDSIPAANTFAEYLIPTSPNSSQRYFEEAPQTLLAAVLHVFLKISPGNWSFRQLLLVMQSIERIEQIAAKDADSHETVQAILSEIGSRGRANLLSTIVSKTRQYKAIAACWEMSEEKIWVKKWLGESSILVLGNYEPAKTEIERLLSMFVDRLAKEVLSQPDNSGNQTWLFLDELTEAGELKGLHSLILRARSKGCVSVLGFQDIGALYEVYGRERGDAFISQCGNRLYLHMKSHVTAEWASNSIGKREAFIGESNAGRNAEHVVPPEHFFKLPEANLHTTGLHGIYMNGSLGCWSASYTPDELRKLLPSDDTSVKRFEPVPNSHCELAPWSNEDSRQFRIQSSSDEAPRPSSTTGPPNDIMPEEDPLKGLGRFRL